ncbi:methyltransferase domain-containing protein [Prochlorococcus marinus]|uniref:methyltransferase domain-containing protein n=1 Tax=Prochlorococcus marinus TaxID=1219 RepID=UPI0039AEC123
MADPNSAYKLFNYYKDHINKSSNEIFDLASKGSFLEIGPGDSLSLPFIFSHFGFGECYAIDKEDYSVPLNLYKINFISKLLQRNELRNSKSILNPQDLYNSIKFITRGSDSFLDIESNSISLIISNAVFEHIDRIEVDFVFSQMHRLLIPGGMFLLIIDFKDHLVGDFFNHLLPLKVWESNFIRRGSHYTNRLTIDDFRSLIVKNKLTINSIRNEKIKRRSFFNSNDKVSMKSIFNGIDRPSSVLYIGSK